MKIKIFWNDAFFNSNKDHFQFELFSNERQYEQGYSFSKRRQFVSIAIWNGNSYLTEKKI